MGEDWTQIDGAGKGQRRFKIVTYSKICIRVKSFTKNFLGILLCGLSALLGDETVSISAHR
jgi:hypothetical protein